MPALERDSVRILARRGGSLAPYRGRFHRGAASIEFAVALPALLTLMLGITYYGLIFAVQQVLTLSAEEGARAALRYQPSNAQRVAAAYTAATASLPPFISSQVTTNQSGAPLVACPTMTSMQCLSVVLTLPVTTGSSPLLPAIPLLPVPATLTGSAVVQLVPGS
ncbi:TadE/TadG family type IV pilus assembly protein [Ralstonia sp. 24A2]|uniref:TadE/TadG family type IV pilus assembly protein n=1 Tax=Ralstonia sp. 24A2 TaxID=3447364 RepID=UPI003F6987A6